MLTARAMSVKPKWEEEKRKNKMKKLFTILGLLVLAGITNAGYFQGDINGDCKVDLIDLAMMGMAWQTVEGDALWNVNADLNNDMTVDLADLSILGRVYKQEC